MKLRNKVRKHLYWGGCFSSGIWTVRIGQRSLQLKAPRYVPLFSERNGYYRWKIEYRGWRVIYDKRER